MARSASTRDGGVPESRADADVQYRLLTEVLALRRQVAALYAEVVPSQPVRRRRGPAIDQRPAAAAAPASRADPPLYATYFGRFTVYREQLPVSLGRNRAVIELCCYLIARAGQLIHRDELLELLWPAVDADRAVNRLHVAISTLRQLLDQHGAGESLLRLENDCYSTAADRFVTDCDAFEQHYRRGLALLGRDARSAADQFRRALDLYAGDYLADLPYAEWVLGHRAHFAERRLSVLAFLCEDAADRGDHASVMEYAQQILGIDNLRERSHRHLMRSHYRLGQRACAVRQYRTCAQVLADELGVRPSHETQQLFAAIRDDAELPDEAPLYG